MPIRELKFRIRIVVEKDEDGSYFAHCPELKGLLVSGANKQEIKENVHHAVMGYLESLIKHGDPVPVGICESDNSYTIIEFIAKKLKERFTRNGNGDYIEEVSIPVEYSFA